jgi:hypothetical protein
MLIPLKKFCSVVLAYVRDRKHTLHDISHNFATTTYIVPSGTVIFRFCKTGVPFLPDPYCFQAPWTETAIRLGGDTGIVFEGFASELTSGGDMAMSRIDNGEDITDSGSSPRFLLYLKQIRTNSIL